MLYKIKIKDSTGLYEIRLLDSSTPNVWFKDGDIIWAESIKYQARYTSNTIASSDTCDLKVFDKYDNLLKVITVNSETIDTANTFTIATAGILLTSKYQEDSDFGTNSTSITFTNLENDILITNTANNDFLFSVNNITWHTDKLPVYETGTDGTKTLYIKRAKETYGFSVADIFFTNGTITNKLTIANYLNSKLNDIWHTPKFLNGWQNYSLDFEELKYTIDRNNVVYIKGIVSSGTAVNIFRLESIYRPLKDNEYITTDNGSIATIVIKSDGYVSVGNIANNTKFSINISYKL